MSILSHWKLELLRLELSDLKDALEKLHPNDQELIEIYARRLQEIAAILEQAAYQIRRENFTIAK